MKIHHHYSWHQTAPGPKGGSFAVECGSHRRRWLVLHVFVLLRWWRDGGGEGTSGPQLVCHSPNPIPAAITTDRLGHDWGLMVSLPEVKAVGSANAPLFYYLVCLFVHLSQGCQLGSHVVCLMHPSICLITNLSFPCCLTPCSYVHACQCASVSIHAAHCFSPYVCFIHLCCSVKPAACVYFTWLTCSRRAACQQQSLHFSSTLTDSSFTMQFPGKCVPGQFTWIHLFHLFQAQSDQLHLFTLPAFPSWSTCSRRAGCWPCSSQGTSALTGRETEPGSHCLFPKDFFFCTSHVQAENWVNWNSMKETQQIYFWNTVKCKKSKVLIQCIEITHERHLPTHTHTPHLPNSFCVFLILLHNSLMFKWLVFRLYGVK